MLDPQDATMRNQSRTLRWVSEFCFVKIPSCLILIGSLGVQLLNKGGYFTKEGNFGLLSKKPPIGKREAQMVMKPWHA